MSDGRIEASGAMADALHAWSRLQRGPEGVDLMSRAKKSAVCRLRGPSSAGFPVIVKQVKREKAELERLFYERILPRLPLSTPSWHGSVEAPGGRFCWLVLGDAQGEPFDPRNSTHRALAAGWLGALHTSEIDPALVAELPERGADDALGHLRAGRELLRARGRDLPRGSAEGEALDRLLQLLDVCEARWAECAGVCADTPATLVHGDFARDNMRIVQKHGRSELVVFDWEFSGVGFPGRDLTLVEPEAYAAVVARAWPAMRGERLERVFQVGRLCRDLTAIHWQAWSVANPWYRRYPGRLARTLEALGW